MALLCITVTVFLCLLSKAVSEDYHILPDESTENCSMCLTLPKLAANSDLFKRNVTLIFFPGLHNLADSLHISDVDYVLMRAFNSTAQVKCETSTGFSFTDVQSLEINSLEFSRCGGSRVVNVEEFVLVNAMFDGQGGTGTALEIVETTAVLINTTFKSNENGTLRSNDSLQNLDLSRVWAGGAIIATNSTINISNCRYESNRAEVGGAIYAEKECNVAIDGTTFVHNQAVDRSPMGGVLYQELGNVSITNCHFVGNSAGNGGVLYSYKANVLLYLNQFAENTATYGGVLSSYNGSVAMDSNQFNRNSATWGGVMHCHNCDLLIDRSQFKDNRATGGAIFHSLSSRVTVNDSQFYLNRATWGGVMLIEGSELTVTGSQFNSSTSTSGAVIYSNTSNISIKNSQFHDNYITSTDQQLGSGGVMYVFRDNVLINGSHFHNNTAVYGGVFYSSNSTIVMNHNQFHANGATSDGGVFFLALSNIIEAGSSFVASTANYGGVVYDLGGSRVSISGGSEFLNNTVGDQGAVIASYTNGTISLNESTFYGNSAATDGGVVHSVQGKVTIGYSNMRRNSALTGGVVYLFGSEITVTESTLDSNSANSRAGVLFCHSGSTVLIQASKLYRNTATTAAVLLCLEGSNVIIQASKLYNNSAIRAGALECTKSNIEIDESKMFGNNSTRGGVLYFSKSKVIITNTEVNNSRAVNGKQGLGGAMYSLKSKVDILTSLFHNNTATGDGAVLYSIDSDITINGSQFIGNVAIFNGGVVSSKTGNVTIQDSYFNKNFAFDGGVVYSNNGNTSINGSQFEDNSAFWGGVVDSFGSGNIAIEGSQFNDNRVTSGGAALRSNKANITMNNNQFCNNTSNRIGGVLYLHACHIVLESNHFMHNTALRGSVLFSSATTIAVHSVVVTKNLASEYGTFYLSRSTIILSDTNFSRNIGSLLALTDTIVNFTSSNSFDSCTQSPANTSKFEEGGALTAFQSTVYLEGETSFQGNRAERGGAVHSVESTLNNTGITLMSNNRADMSGGGIYLSQSEIFIEPSSSIKLVNNSASKKGGGVHAVSSSIKITVVMNETLLKVEENMAENGGGLLFESNSKIYVLINNPLAQYPVCVAQIIGNVADYGGAVFVNDDSNAATCRSPSTECFFQVLAFHLEQYSNINTTSLCFSENHARKSNFSDTLFGGLLDRCTVSPLAEVHNKIPDINVINYVYNGSGLAYFAESAVITPDTISSDPVQVCFCFNGYPDCSYLQPENVEVKKGQPFIISLVAVDQVGKSINASVQSALKFTQSGLAEGQLTQRTTENCSNIKFNVFSPEPYEELTLFADGPCQRAKLSTRSIRIQFLPCTCTIGFQPEDINGTACNCQCHKNISDYVVCDSRNETFMRSEFSSNVWISYSNTSGYLIYPNCPYDYCKPLSFNTPILLSYPNGSDAQCAFNRVSLLCGSCEPGLSLSLGNSRCLLCPAHWPALMVLITLAAAVSGVALVAVLLYLNLTVTVGSLNGIIFYANVVAAKKSIFFSYQAETSFTSIFISFLNLDFGIDTCFFQGMDTYSRTWLQLLFPFYVIILVILIIVISSYSSRFSNLIGKRDPVATLATLILLSYARLLEISLIALSAGTLSYPDGTYQVVWLPDATISYCASVHVPLFIVAVLITILVLAYAIIVFLWQWLLRLPKWRVFAWTRNQKLQIFIEKYNIPYTHRHRYWTGILLFVRVILYLVATVNVSNDPHVALTSIVFAVVCILCLKGAIRGPLFKMWLVDLLETFFYFNILFLAVFTWSFQSSVDTINQEVVTNISVVVTFIALLLIILCHAYSYTPVFSKVHQTKFGKNLNKVLKSLSKSNAKQHAYETSEDNLLDLVSRSDRELEVSVKQKLTHSVIEVTLTPEPTSTEEMQSNNEYIISPHREYESEGVLQDMEGHNVDKKQGMPQPYETKL